MAGSKNLDSLITETLNYLEERQYAKATLETMRWRFARLRLFARQHGKKSFSADLSKKFIASLVPSYVARETTFCGWKAAMRILTEFAQNGRHRITPPRNRWPLPTYFENSIRALDAFIQRELGWTPHTRAVGLCCLRRFVTFLHAKRSIKHWDDIRPADITSFVQADPQYSRSTRITIYGRLRSLLRALFVLGDLLRPIHEQFPKLSFAGKNGPPALWRPEEFARLLAVIDRDTPRGRRDYAILLLASRLGLRAGDIASLRCDALHWDENRIELIQRKTGRRLLLPLLPEVGDAIAAYLRNGRPDSDVPEIFLRHKAPVGPMGHLSEVVKRYQCLAGLPHIPWRRLHALRHTLATRLLGEGASLPTISACLGHSGLEITRRYLSVELTMLREAALDPDGETAHA